jgi:epoxyqueuosine reductase
LEACPTQAIEKPYFVNSSKCISYLTIESREPIPTKYWQHLGTTIYGCDICQEVCPYNYRTTTPTHISEFSKTNSHLDLISAESIALMTQAQYEEWFGGTAMTRAKKAGLIRNALIHMCVTNQGRALEIASQLRNDPFELVRATCAQILHNFG